MINTKFILGGIFVFTAIGISELSAGEGDPVKFTITGLRAVQEQRENKKLKNKESLEIPVKSFDFEVPEQQVKIFNLNKTYLEKPTIVTKEKRQKATKDIRWNFELTNKNDKNCFLTIESFYPRYEPLVEQEKIRARAKIRFLFRKDQTESTLLNGYYIIKIWGADTPVDDKPDIVKVVVTRNANAFLTLDGEELLPQVGSKTESGLSLKGNTNEIYPEIVLKTYPEFNMEWKRANDEKLAIEEYKKSLDQYNSSESSSSSTSSKKSSLKKIKKNSSVLDSEETQSKIFDEDSN